MVNPNDVSEVVPYLTSAALIVYAQKWLKTTARYQELVSAIPWADKWCHRTVAALGALLTATGIHMTYSGSWHEGYKALIQIPDGMSLLHGFGDFVKEYVLQQTVYDATKTK